MKAAEIRVTGLLKLEDRQYQIPLYQRAYAWERKDWVTLWEDVLEQYEAVNEESPVNTVHFLGAVVLAPAVDHQASFNKFVVVDGQQRLVTLSIALAVLRDRWREADAQMAERLEKQYLVNTYRNGDDQLRILPTQVDRPIYRKIILGSKESVERAGGIGEAYDYFSRQIKAMHREHGDLIFEPLEEALTARLSLVDVTCDPGENPHRIFASLNGKGRPLTEADLVRNHVFMLLGERGQAVYENYWVNLARSLSGSDELESLMWLKLVLDGDRETRRLNLYSDQQAWFERRGNAIVAAEEYVADLDRLLPLYQRIIKPEEEKHPTVRECLSRLLRWKAVAAHPAIMVLLRGRLEGQLEGADVVDGLCLIESFLVRRSLAGQNTSGLARIFQSIPAQLAEQPGGIVEGLHKVLSLRRRRWPNDRELREAMRTKKFYEQAGQGGQQRRFILQSLEESFAHPEPVDFTTGKFTIEHVMPQTPTQEWLDALVDSDGEETPREIHRRLVDTIGNLTLTAVNGSLSNHAFDRKKELYEQSHLELNREIADAPEWCEYEISARADRLAERAIELWPSPLDEPDGTEIPSKLKIAHEKLAALPAGFWTTYKDLADLCGSSAMAVASHMKAADYVPNAHRVLQVNRKIAPNFIYKDGRTAADVPAMLAADGIQLDANGRAPQEQRLCASQLMELPTLLS